MEYIPSYYSKSNPIGSLNAQKVAEEVFFVLTGWRAGNPILNSFSKTASTISSALNILTGVCLLTITDITDSKATVVLRPLLLSY